MSDAQTVSGQDPVNPVDPDDPESPWHGIPAELLDGTHSYDTDSAGGCG